MRLGPPRGDSTSLELTVTDDLAAPAGPGAPAVCPAPTLLTAAEVASRRLVDPHLEAGELAVAVAVDVALRTFLPVGATATVTATVALVTPTKLVSEVLITAGTTRVARGAVEHRIVDAATFAAEVAERAPSAV